jgi:hypothetical protein
MMDSVLFHPFELSYLLGMMRAESVAGIPDAVLFPAKPELRAKVAAEGLRRLSARKLILPLPDEPGRAVYEEGLLQMAAALADPRLVIIVHVDTPDGPRFASVFLTNTLALELVQVSKDSFQVTRLMDVTAAFQQIRYTLDIPAFAPKRPSAKLDRPALLALRTMEMEQAAAHFPEWPEEELQGLLKALSAGPQSSVTLLRRRNQRFSDVRAMAVYRDNEAAWLSIPPTNDKDPLEILPADTPTFIASLLTLFASLA